MKNFKKITLGVLGAALLALGLYSCNNDESKELNQVQNFNARMSNIVSPEGFVLSQSENELKEFLFVKDTELYEILNIEFINVGSDKGAIAYVSYEHDNIVKNLAIAVGDIKFNYRSSEFNIEKRNSGLKLNGALGGTIFKCNGQGCCYVGGTTDLNTGEHTFFCKCENNPEQNSGCSLTVIIEGGYIPPHISPR